MLIYSASDILNRYSSKKDFGVAPVILVMSMSNRPGSYMYFLSS